MCILIIYFNYYYYYYIIVTVGFRGPPENPEECVPGAKMVENSLVKLSEVVLNAMGLVATPLRSQLADLMTGTLSALVNVFYFYFYYYLFYYIHIYLKNNFYLNQFNLIVN